MESFATSLFAIEFYEDHRTSACTLDFQSPSSPGHPRYADDDITTRDFKCVVLRSGGVSQDAPFFSHPIAVFLRRALVVLLFALGQADGDFCAATRPVQVQRHDGIAGALDLADQQADLLALQQQLAGAGGIRMDVGRGLQQRNEMRAEQPGFVFLDDDVGLGDLCLAHPQTFDFPAFEGEPGFKCLFYEVVEARTTVLRDLTLRIWFGFGVGHQGIIGGMREATAGMIGIEVVCALPDEQALVSLRMPVGTTALEAVSVSGLLERFPQFNADSLRIGIFGQRVRAEQQLTDGDRIELYRSLQADPKQARRRRARR